MTPRGGAAQPGRNGPAEAARQAKQSPPEAERIVIRDKRKVGQSGGKSAGKAKQAAGAEKAPSAGKGEPRVEQAGQVPSPAEHAQPQAETEAAKPVTGGVADELAQLRATLDERTGDLQRVSAEYANYRKRVDRDRALATETAVAMVLSSLLPVLDDLDRAREHGDLDGPFAAVAEQLSNAVAKLGLVSFGAKGDPFDPKRHEAVAHVPSAEVTEPTCVEVMRRGYLMGERLVRPAMVAVAAPE